METQKQIRELCDAMRDFLLEKNKRYGDAALQPAKIFSNLDAADSIKIRLDDKLNRIINNRHSEPRANDVCDVIGYCFLLLISMGVTKEEIIKLID